MKSKNQCVLCSQKADLKNSHIIPKFVIKYLKETSIGIRDTKNPNMRVQDGKKIYMLCENCEQLFSSYEKYFSEQLFMPFLNNGRIIYDYDEKLFYFMTSISWRILYYEVLCDEENYKDLSDEQLQFYRDMEEILRNFLLGKTKNIGDIQHHISFFSSYDELNWDNKDLIKDKNPNLSVRRTIGSRIFENKKFGVSGSSANLCGVILYTFYKNEENSGFRNTQIFNKTSTLDTSIQKIDDVMGYELLNYVAERSSYINNKSSFQSKKIKAVMEDKKSQHKLQKYHEERTKDNQLIDDKKSSVIIKID